MTFAAIVAQLAAAGVPRAYAENAVPTKPDYPYVVAGFGPSAPAAKTNDGHAHVVGWVTIRVFARSTDSHRAITTAVDAALNGRVLPLPGSPVAEFLQASQMSRDADDSGVIGAVLVYRY